METRKTNRFWKLRARAAEGKPTYQSSRVKGIIKINKSSSAKSRLCMNEKKTGGQRNDSPVPGLANSALSRHSRGKEPPGRPRGGWSEKKTTPEQKTKLKLHRVPKGGTGQRRCARAVPAGSAPVDLLPTRQLMQEGEQRVPPVTSSCLGQGEHTWKHSLGKLPQSKE